MAQLGIIMYASELLVNLKVLVSHRFGGDDLRWYISWK